MHSIPDELLLMLYAEVFIDSLSLVRIPYLMHLLFFVTTATFEAHSHAVLD